MEVASLHLLIIFYNRLNSFLRHSSFFNPLAPAPRKAGSLFNPKSAIPNPQSEDPQPATRNTQPAPLNLPANKKIHCIFFLYIYQNRFISVLKLPPFSASQINNQFLFN
jgi:hypothetical protein